MCSSMRTTPTALSIGRIVSDDGVTSSDGRVCVLVCERLPLRSRSGALYPYPSVSSDDLARVPHLDTIVVAPIWQNSADTHILNRDYSLHDAGTASTIVRLRSKKSGAREHSVCQAASHKPKRSRASNVCNVRRPTHPEVSEGRQRGRGGRRWRGRGGAGRGGGGSAETFLSSGCERAENLSARPAFACARTGFTRILP